ncbi:glutamine--fructose-6-phosphate aminotransferase [Halobiforma lacisalsi AJ5]|uniref:Glutamine--fructose-6-phosphate aminotransferase [isomerizing] n=1 Tax=Natronobacterium lacisalsi AJ5 TaxID=358396 RepID=M0L6X1_NATLA|nr:glutamine--fructose-6-phosphate transaminase (isomerizing) [Halobiforma lacisalsi]APW98204.1 glutamine--fructose-6-phosphate aminotransferase [Halobiforma lacisalsi AJ5]EMA28189.1 glucosamine/fructose-6-phosphate aminotransferase [Halobiforma lacisalsi AJ5]
MCGIVGYVGVDDGPDALEVLLNGLSTLEYRGYDSAGVALANASLSVHKSEGELSELRSTLPEESLRGERTGIGHTRWSTHGPPSDANAHPHTDTEGRVAVVHNGIVENYQELRDELTDAGVSFDSETDTEVVPHLIASHLEAGDDPEQAFRRAIDRLEGSYAIAAVVAGGDEIFAARNESPLVVGVGDDGHYLASDVPAFIDHTDRVIYVDDGEFVRLSATGRRITDADGEVVEKPVETVDWDAEDTGKSGYDHYMLKEIHEQPTALRQCLRGRVDELAGEITLDDLDGLEHDGPIQFVACGTSYHAAVHAATICRERGMRANAYVASEYAADRVPVDGETLVVGVTQSGETADTLRALREAKRSGARTLAVTNTVGSSVTRVCDDTLYIRAGPEIGVAATKTFASQQIALTLLAGQLNGGLSYDAIEALRSVPDQVQTVLDTSDAKTVAEELVGSDAFLFIGRGLAYPVALEGALKFKEITYEHAEGFAAGELKHGPLALVTDETPVFAVVTGDGETARKTISNIKEVEARDAPVVVVTDGRSEAERYADYVLEIPATDDVGAAVVANVQLQLVSYWVANLMGRSIDKPRNLAKSVTVE